MHLIFVHFNSRFPGVAITGPAGVRCLLVRSGDGCALPGIERPGKDGVSRRACLTGPSLSEGDDCYCCPCSCFFVSIPSGTWWIKVRWQANDKSSFRGCLRGGASFKPYLVLLSEWKSLSRAPVLWPHGPYSLWNSPGQNTGVGSLIPSPGDLPNPGIEPRSPVFQADSWPAEPPGKPLVLLMLWSIGAHGAQETVLVPCFSQISERAIQLLAANKALATNI